MIAPPGLSVEPSVSDKDGLNPSQEETMRGTNGGWLIASIGFFALAPMGAAQAQSAQDTTFFVTSVGSGKGADLGGLEGADRHCQTLAEAAGIRGKMWPAYPSTQRTNRRQCERPHRPRSVAERQGHRHRQGRGGPARRQQQSHQADGPEREGRDGEGPRRSA